MNNGEGRWGETVSQGFLLNRCSASQSEQRLCLFLRLYFYWFTVLFYCVLEYIQHVFKCQLTVKNTSLNSVFMKGFIDAIHNIFQCAVFIVSGNGHS